MIRGPGVQPGVPRSTHRATTLIVGAGPYGVSVALALHAAGIPFTIVGHPFSLWLHHTLDGTRLRSDWPSSSIPSWSGATGAKAFWDERLGPVAGHPGGPIPIADFRAYLEWVRRRLPFQIIEDHVARLEPVGHHYRAWTERGVLLEAARVVLATGLAGHRYIPPLLQALPVERVAHSFEVTRYSNLSGARVLVVGGGQSGAETVLHLARRNEVAWHHRSPLRFRSLPLDLPKPAYTAIRRGVGWLRYLPNRMRAPVCHAFVRASITPELRRALRAIPTVEAAALKGLRTVNDAPVDGAGRRYDFVVACTGYRPAWEGLGFLDGSLRRRLETSAISARFETAVPGCFAVGKLAEPSSGPAMGFLLGCPVAAKSFASWKQAAG